MSDQIWIRSPSGYSYEEFLSRTTQSNLITQFDAIRPNNQPEIPKFEFAKRISVANPVKYFTITSKYQSN